MTEVFVEQPLASPGSANKWNGSISLMKEYIKQYTRRPAADTEKMAAFKIWSLSFVHNQNIFPYQIILNIQKIILSCFVVKNYANYCWMTILSIIIWMKNPFVHFSWWGPENRIVKCCLYKVDGWLYHTWRAAHFIFLSFRSTCTSSILGKWTCFWWYLRLINGRKEKPGEQWSWC